MNKPVVAIVGRPNVGKSTLFNRIAGQSIAIVEDFPGTTRDRVYTDIYIEDKVFVLVDTGGLEIGVEDGMGRMVRSQIDMAIADADVIIFIVDVTAGVTIPDQEIAEILRRSDKPVVLVANKCDNSSRAKLVPQFYELNSGDPVPISAHHGLGTRDLIDSFIDLIPSASDTLLEDNDVMKVAIVGRPNVGKSMLINAILGTDRSIVSDVPGTTRDAIDTTIEYDGDKVVLIDTGGIRRRGRVERGIEKYSVVRAVRAISRADIAVVVTDVTEPLTAQDSHIAGYVRDAYKGMVLVVNKWDLAAGLEVEAPSLTDQIQARLRFFAGVPVLYTSAKYGEGVENVLKAAKKIYIERTRRYPTSRVNAVVKEALARHRPATVKGRKLNILYATQSDVNPPTFVLFVNDTELLHFSYKRYLENKLRKAFDFRTTPLNLIFKNRSEQ